jgi:hypothetical protein
LKKPSPTVNKAVRKKENFPLLLQERIKKMSQMQCPAESVFLYPNFCKTSTFSDIKKKIIDPKGYRRPKLLVEIELVIKLNTLNTESIYHWQTNKTPKEEDDY